MRQTVRFVVLLVVGVSVLTFIADDVMTRTNRRWFESDIQQRAQLAVAAARQSLVSEVRTDDRRALVAQLREITRDVRIVGAAVCAPDGELIASTAYYPASLTCRSINANRHSAPSAVAGAPWSMDAMLPGGPLHVSAVAIMEGDREAGLAVVVHDMSWESSVGSAL